METIDRIKQTIESLSDFMEDLDTEFESAKGKEYKICGEKVMIRCDNIAHETFFEQLEAVSKLYSINQLTEKIRRI